MQLSVFALSDTCNLAFKHINIISITCIHLMYRYSVHVTCNELKYKGQNLTGDLNAVPCGLLEPVELNVKKYNEHKIGKQIFVLPHLTKIYWFS